MNVQILHGDNRQVMANMPDATIDAIVTDPPYELAFMGKKWDASGIAYQVDLWMECLRVLKPGGHLLAFGGTRTYHRMAVAIEDAGFEIRDSIHWVYGSGFPKSLDVSKAIHKSLLTTDEAHHWNGWGTALKPAHEPIVLARKPLEGTVAANVLQHGTGALNIDATRIPHGAEVNLDQKQRQQTEGTGRSIGKGYVAAILGNEIPMYKPGGRWPANIVLDQAAREALNQQSGNVKGGTWNTTEGARHFNNDGKQTNYKTNKQDKTTGGASRFFTQADFGPDDWPFVYQAKPSRKERNAGLNSTNQHPTVKPVALMRHLVKLVTPPNGTVLDPFAGSGTTLIAAIHEEFNCTGIELQEEYIPIIQARIKHAQNTKPPLEFNQ